MKVVLEILQGGVPGQKVDLGEGQRVTAGRAADCEIQLLDKGVSRRHLAAYVTGGEVFVEDLGSSNGTFLNGQRVRKARLSNGDLIRVGLGAIRVKVGGAAAKRAVGTGEGSSSSVTPISDIFATRIRKRLDPDRSMLLKLDLADATLKRAHRNLACLYKLSNELQAATDVDSISEILVRQLRHDIGATKVALVMLSHSGRPALAAASGAPEGFFPPDVIVEEVLSGLSTLIRDIEADERVQAGSIDDDVTSIICTPVAAGGETLGALYAESGPGRVFDEVEMELLAAAGGQVAMLAQRARMHRETEDLFFSAIRALAGAVDAKDHYTKGHSERVTAYAVRLARHISMEEQEVETVQLAAILHDVGKIGVPEGILNKPGPLTEEELALVQEHPTRGREIIAAIKSTLIPSVLEGILHHHERWDGSGYPDGIAGLDIPLVARVLALADAFDAMTTDRPYREAYPADYAISLVGESAGTQFDPELADRFLDLYYAGRLVISTRPDHYDTQMSVKRDTTPPPFTIKAT